LFFVVRFIETTEYFNTELELTHHICNNSTHVFDIGLSVTSSSGREFELPKCRLGLY